MSATVKRRHRRIARGVLLTLQAMPLRERRRVIAALLEQLLAARGLVERVKEGGQG
jgi:hypothetical protein